MDLTTIDERVVALDRNGNGTIDDGGELFGDVTPQSTPPKGKHRNGFLALAEYDKPENGGNGDGVIDKQDAIYAKLLLWNDKNHDGISQPDELSTLAEHGIAAIDLHYEESRRQDVYGNIFRYRSKIYREGRIHDGRWTYDVILLETKGK